MAYTVTTVDKNVTGKNREHVLLVTADAASGVIDTGMSRVDGYGYAPVSVATAGFKLKANLNDSSATANGKIFCSSAANGDAFFLIVKGR